MVRVFVLVAVLLGAAHVSPAQTVPAAPPTEQSNDDGGRDDRPEKRSDRDHNTGWAYGSHGLQYRSADGRWLQWFTLRNQFRLTSESDQEQLAVNRSRFKLGGNLGTPAVQDFVEIDLKTPRFYHFFVTIRAREWLQFRAGQWKVEFNRERVDSSGDQQLVDRSIVNADFTLDGQLGAMVRGRVRRGRPLDGEYFLGVLAGEGRLALGDGDGVPMILGRYQWNVLGKSVGFSQSDVDYHEAPAMAIGVAGVNNRGRFTRFDSNGGASLDGFETGTPGQYDLRQCMVDTALFNRGFSLQAEQHWKRVSDRTRQIERRLIGGYLMAGYFPFHRWPAFPPALEVAARLAYEDPDRSLSGDHHGEQTLGVNWYFNQHRNKINFDLSRLIDGSASHVRLRLQWDLSL